MMEDLGSALPQRSLLYRVGKRWRPAFDRVMANCSKAPDQPVLDPADFPWTARLEAGWARIRAEALAALADLNAAAPPLRDISPDHRRIAEPDRWRSYFLWGYGYRMEANCRDCPETVALLEGVPGLNSAFFSILKPGAHIPRHRGAWRQTELHRIADERMQDVADERYLVNQRDDRCHEQWPDDGKLLQRLQEWRLRDGDDVGWRIGCGQRAEGRCRFDVG